MFTLISI